jgi:hypothetical protein
MTRRIFNLSLHRSGTKSFIDFCTRNNLPSLHFPGVGFDLLCRPALHSLDSRYIWSLYNYISDGYQAFADIPVPMLYREAMAQSADATFLMILRPAPEWIRSIRQYIRERPLAVLEIFQYGMLSGRLVNKLTALSDDVLERGYGQFCHRVAQEAADRGVRFKTFQLNDPQIGGKLANYLGLKLTDEFRHFDRLPTHEPAVSVGAK